MSAKASAVETSAPCRRGAGSPARALLGARAAWAVPLGLALVGAALDGASSFAPARLPVVLPFDFSWFAWAGTVLPLWWWARGIALLAPEERPPVWRRVAFVAGVGVLWAVLQTRYLYLAEHEFFLGRIMHDALHHVGPFLVALGLAGEPIRAAMPASLRRVVESRPVRAALAPLMQPSVAATLFVGLVALWLWPPFEFASMIGHRLFWIMNWSMVLDGLLFWCQVLDPRPSPPARAGYGARAAMAVGVIFPQIAIGAFIVFARHDIYPFYNYCGRFYPDISPLYDQLIGGMVVWIPPAMMSVAALLIVLSHLRAAEDAAPPSLDPRAARMAALSARWTGR
ncbi:MAG: cytochrome c oxidase assembly protein [Acetobacteraceae bacterium]